jgi:hypothetical protein
MRRLVKSLSNCFSIRTIVLVTLSFVSLFIFASLGKSQTFERFPITADKNKPLEAPTKTTPPTKQQKSQKPAQTRQDPVQDPNLNAPLNSGCVFEDILVLDTIRIVFVRLFDFPPNSAIPVTATQTNAGVVGYALTPAGPFAPTLNTVVNTDSNGYGESVDIYTQGQLVGTTTTYADTPYGPTSYIVFNVLPQCNCPPIPLVP